MLQKTRYIWQDGKFVPWQAARVHVLTHSLHYGAAVFEGIRFYETENGVAIFRLEEHVDRLFRSAKSIYIKIPFSKQQIKKAIVECVARNRIKSGYIRPLAFYGYGIMGVDPSKSPVNVIIACWPWGIYLGTHKARVKISSYMRIHPKSLHADMKVSGHYVNSILAGHEARVKGYTEAIFLDFQNKVAEGSGENIFIVKNCMIYTPKLKGQILPGITRDTIIKLSRDLGIKVIEKDLTKQELYNVDELFFTGTAVEIHEIESVDGKQIRNKNKNCSGIAAQMKELYSQVVRGKVPRYRKWLTYVK